MTEPLTSYDWYYKALEQGSYRGLPIHETEPQAGYYRVRNKQGGFSAISIFPEGGALVALRDGEEVDAEQIWTWCLKYPPITYDLYQHVEGGGAWPAELPPMIGSNSGEDMPADVAIKSELEERAVQFRKWLKSIGGNITTQEHAEKAGSFFKWFQSKGGKADKDREAEKRPHLNACREVDAKWSPIIALAKKLASEANAPVTAFLLAERKRREEEARVKAEEARAAAAEAERKRLEEVERAALENRPPPPEPVAQPAAVAAPEPVRVTTETGRNVGLTIIKKAAITDLDALLAHYVRDSRFRDHVDVSRLLTRFAKEDLNGGKEVPGATLVDDARAA